MSHTINPAIARQAGQNFVLWIDSLRLATPMQYAGLGLIPIYSATESEQAETPSYRILANALATEQVRVAEEPTPTVPRLRVENLGDLPVLILAGEELSGGLQNRTCDVTVLVPAHSTLSLPVTCIEQGRWQNPSAFTAGVVAAPYLRSVLADSVTVHRRQQHGVEANQGAIWEEVERYLSRSGSASTTRAFRDIEQRQQDRLRKAQEALPYPGGHPIGVVTMIGGHARSADLFDHPRTLEAYWPRLVRAAMIDAGDAPPVPPRRASAWRQLVYAVGTEREVYASPGVGLDLRLSGYKVTGSALIYEGMPVQATIFRKQNG